MVDARLQAARPANLRLQAMLSLTKTRKFGGRFWQVRVSLASTHGTFSRYTIHNSHGAHKITSLSTRHKMPTPLTSNHCPWAAVDWSAFTRNSMPSFFCSSPFAA